MATYTRIGSSVLSTTTASVTLSSIPSTYTDVVLRISSRTNAANTWGQLLVSYSSATSTYSDVYVYGDGASVSAFINTGNTENRFVYFTDAANATANTFSNAEIYIPRYLSSSSKPISGFGVQEDNAATAYMSISAALWTNSNPVTSITITPGSGSFVSGSSFYLYGVFNGPETLPSTPTIGTATAGNASASVTFTPTSASSVDASYTLLSSPGSVTATGASSPISITGLTNGTAYTFQVRANNPGGSSAYSSASNSVTPIDPAAFESIASYVGTGSASTFTFSSIPSTYKHLQIRAISRNAAGGGASSNVQIYFNGASTTYWGHFVEGASGSAGSSYWSNSTGIIINRLTQGSAAATNMMGVGIIDIIDYASTTKNKTVRAWTGVQDNSVTYSSVDIVSGAWTNTSAINSITITDDNGRAFNTQTVFALYGIKG